MKIENLLPIGSVVRLTDAKKKVVIMGIMPVKHMPDGEDIIYDYLGVPYPEGYMTQETGLLFNHDKIERLFLKVMPMKKENYLCKLYSRLLM